MDDRPDPATASSDDLLAEVGRAEARLAQLRGVLSDLEIHLMEASITQLKADAARAQQEGR